MSFTSWLQILRSALAPSRGQRHHQRSLQARHRPSFEVLEDRCVPALYTVTELGALGGTYSYAADLNEAGQVVGHAETATGYLHAFLWDNGTMIDLGLGAAYGINDLGQVVGSNGNHAFLVTPQGGVWFQDSDLDGRNDFMIDLGTLDGSPLSVALDINNAGQVVGASNSRVFLWDAANGMTDLGTSTSGGFSVPYGINESGQVVGQWWNQARALLWTPDSPNGITGDFIDLGALLGGEYSGAVAINDAGQVVGDSTVDNIYVQPEAFRWDAVGGMTSLGFLPDGFASGAADINNTGQVVGYSAVDISDFSTLRPFVWDATNGMVDLHKQLVAGPAANLLLQSYDHQFADAISDSGSIVVNRDNAGFDGGAFLLTPIPASTPLISIAHAPAVTEGNTGTRAATFTVTLSVASNQTVTVAYATGLGSATAGSDYQSASSTLTFAPGETSKTITVLVTGDRFPEPNESVVVSLSSSTNAIIVDGQGAVVIVDDEPRISISDISKAEGKKGQTTLFTFTVTLSAAYDQPVTMSFSTVNGTATTSSGDYVAKTGTLTFAPGETTKTITIEVKGDNKKEANETFYLDLYGLSSNGLFTKSRGLGTILNDD